MMQESSLVPEQQVIVDQFWRYSLQVYAAPEVKSLCLSLQNKYQCNVNLLLWLGFCKQQRWMVNLDYLQRNIDDSEQKLKQFRDYRSVVKPLISQRQYDLLLQHELKLEQRQQQKLVISQQRYPGGQPAEQALSAYLEQVELSPEEYIQRVALALG
ncbi:MULTISPECIES: TIGR02444 family protein [unclassified Agarivorans]|uniref:TIGR02444 family protein n=1 Tax=unclassified Agarivorans TaxID=2636026 RepID=UPI003D7D6D4A